METGNANSVNQQGCITRPSFVAEMRRKMGKMGVGKMENGGQVPVKSCYNPDMARNPRIDVGGYAYHVLNRANARLPIFFKEEDYEMLESILEDAYEKYDMRILAYCLMPNHFHLVLYPQKDCDLQKFMQWVTLTHTQRWHTKNKTTGTGHLYQGRYKSVLVQDDEHLLGLIRYVERNPLRAKLVKNLNNWRFSSYWRHRHGTAEQKRMLADWPIDVPKDYDAFIHDSITPEELSELREAIQRHRLYGSENWTANMKKKFKIPESKPPGRPTTGT
ncbi:MAG: transposase [Patescibacteria group bacterium]